MHPFEAGDATWGRRRQGLDYLQPKEEASILLVRGSPLSSSFCGLSRALPVRVQRSKNRVPGFHYLF